MVREKSEKNKTFSKLKVKEFCICIFLVHKILWKEFESEDRNIDDQQKKAKAKGVLKTKTSRTKTKTPKKDPQNSKTKTQRT